MSEFKPSGEFLIESARYEWNVRHYAGASTPYSNHCGLSASIRLQAEGSRELIVDFPIRGYFFSSKPKSAAEFEKRLREIIPHAIEAGWKPESRGKPFRLKIEDTQNKK